MEGSTSKGKDGQIMVLEHDHPLELVDLQRKRQHIEETDGDDIDLDTVPEFRGQCGRCSQIKMLDIHLNAVFVVLIFGRKIIFGFINARNVEMLVLCPSQLCNFKNRAFHVYLVFFWAWKNYIDAQHPDLLHLPFTDQNHSIQKHMLSKSARTHIIHQHPLILVDAQSKHTTMSTSSDIKPLPCHDPLKKIELLCNACYELIFKCSQCKFAIHYDCCRALSSYRDEDEDFDNDELSNSNSD
nr:hypothetical protein [Tanacetum cinerariifolium]